MQPSHEAEGAGPLIAPDEARPVTVEGPEEGGQAVLVCEHASNRIPRTLGTLGLDEPALRSHVAWDPGALALARALAERLDAPLVHAGYSRLVHDVNRPAASEAAMPTRSEVFDIPGNRGLTEADRQARAQALYEPFHEAIGALLDRRAEAGRPSALVTVHSFTPVWFGKPRAVDVGILHDADARLADAMLDRLPVTMPKRRVARNAPYGPEHGVTHTLVVHALPRGIPNVMIEVANNLLTEPGAIEAVADELAEALAGALAALVANGTEGRR